MPGAPDDPPPILFEDDPVGHYWKRPFSEVATVPRWTFAAADAERHRIYSLALMALLEYYWNGNKSGFHGKYKWRDSQAWSGNTDMWLCKPPLPAAPKVAPPTDYLGHNIAALAVDGNGEIIDFDFNHNEVFDSSAEHAEARLVRRIFSLAQIGSRWNLAPGVAPDTDYSTRLTNVTVYTTLECCAQCSGIMTLGRVKEVVYLQKDYGTYAIGNVLYQLTHDPSTGRGKPVAAPKPIRAEDFGLEHYTALDAAYRQFFKKAGTEPFFNGKSTQSVAAFLCTDIAYQIYKSGADQFASIAPAAPDYAPVAGMLTNKRALEEARNFVNYAKNYGNRGTSHL